MISTEYLLRAKEDEEIWEIFLLRFLSVAGYSCSRLTGVSFFTLVHTSDIGPVAKAFKNCKYSCDKLNILIEHFVTYHHLHPSEASLKMIHDHLSMNAFSVKEHSQMETPVYRLLCGGGGWVWVQTRACLSANRRGSSKPGAVTVTTTQIRWKH